MANTLVDIMRNAYMRIGEWNESVATGGTTATIVDTKLVGVGVDDDWNEGRAFIVYDAGGAGAAPEGETRRISDYVDSTGTFTVDTVFSASPAATDRYGYVSEYYPWHTMIGLLNSTLQSLGRIPIVDTTTLDTVSAETEYDYELAWKRTPPYRIDMQRKTTGDNDNKWAEISRGSWEYIPSTAGATGLIVFQKYMPADRDLRVWYEAVHPYVQADDDAIYEHFHEELVTLALVEKALEWQNTRLQGGDDFLLSRWNDAKNQLFQAKQEYITWKPPRRAKLMIPYSTYNEVDRFTYPGPA